MSSHDNSRGEVKSPEEMRQWIAREIKDSPQSIEAEAAKETPLGKNSWVACYKTRLSILYFLVDGAEGILPRDETEAMVLKLGLIESKLAGLTDPKLENVMFPSQAERNELMKMLDILSKSDDAATAEQ